MLHHMLRAAAQRAFNVLDPYFQYVTMLLHGDGTNGAQNNTFLDSSTNNFTITRNGNTTQGTFTPYGSNWSNYFDGTGDYLTTPSNAAFDFGTGDFTVEFWVNSSIATLSAFVGTRTADTSSTIRWCIYGETATGGIALACDIFDTSNNRITTFPFQSLLPINSWVHCALVRSGTSFRLYQNGVQSTSSATSSAAVANSSTVVNIGSFVSSAIPNLNGYLSNLRILKGTALYTTSTYTVPTAPLTAITNTSLLTCQSNRFIDNSSNAFTITKNGDVSVQRFSPFSPTTAYSTSVIGGSGYFDGSDSLTVATTATLSFGTGDFTCEAWVYKTTATNSSIFDARVAPGGAAPWAFYIDGSNFPYFYDGTVYTSSVAVILNAWTHIAAVRTSGTLKIFVNGVQGYSAAVGTNLDRSAGVFIGVSANTSTPSAYFTGFMTDARVVKATAVYTTAFTPNTAPLTAITNTSLLLNYTNAGILDNAMMNDLETVGNAQISTSVKKYGTGSMAFDGSGDYLTTYDPSYELSVGSGDFTFECWVYVNSLPATVTALYHLKNDAALATTVFILELTPSGAISLSTGAALIASGTNGKITTGSWIHFAFVRTSGVFKTFFNGVQDISTSNTTTYNGTYLQIGAWRYSGYDFSLNGYIDDLRITKGVARYTANFTAPTAAFPNN